MKISIQSVSPSRILCAILAPVLLLVTACHTPTSRPSVPQSAPVALEKAAPSSSLTVCSFNIQFLGHFTKKDHQALADLVKDYDLVVIQELIASPASTGSTRQRAKLFFDAMAAHGFSYVLSESDTGKKGPLPNYTTATEWFVTFFKPGRVSSVSDLPHGFISSPLAANPDFVRVPYASAFRSTGGGCDFVLVSVHLEPDDAQVRAREFRAIDRWLKEQYAGQRERDFIVLGDTNLQSAAELTANTPENFISLNERCVQTNTIPTLKKPYDHVFLNPQFTTEVDRAFGFKVVNLIDAMRPGWKGPGPYPGSPYVHDEFRVRYSDHNPVVFRINVSGPDDD